MSLIESFNLIQLSSNKISFDNHTVFLKYIGSISIDKKNIQSAIRKSFFDTPVWEWTLRLETLQGKEFIIQTISPVILEFKEAIEKNISEENSEIYLSFDLSNGVMQESSFKNAKESGYTNFGNLDDSSKVTPTKLQINKDIKWIDNGDGTVTDEVNRTMWIKAPWGMFGNNEFSGNPIKISWIDAKNLFGEGVKAVNKEGGGWLDRDALEQSQFKNGYIDGTCRICHAGYTDWRLPTAVEWETIQIMNDRYHFISEKYIEFDDKERFLHQLFPYTTEDQQFWTATGKLEKEEVHGFLFTTLIAVELIIRRLFNIPLPSGCLAWISDFGRVIDENSSVKCPVFFIRDCEKN